MNETYTIDNLSLAEKMELWNKEFWNKQYREALLADYEHKLETLDGCEKR